MKKSICIHGHFYQPPREDPWLGEILPEGSAAPALHWNERILRESYAPMAWARRLDGSGHIADILNCYEWISFNAGPTLMRWLERDAPETYARMLEADRRSITRWGHGNALAQVSHHVIMPLATPRQRRLEILWALDDFAYRFGRPAQGMWLAESAADVPTLEDLAAHGIQFTVLAPRQARRVCSPDGVWTSVDENSLDIYRPYTIDLPSGKSISVFFYHGPISRAVAFEKLLQDGEGFWQRIAGAAREGLLTLCTDGETYGHHFMFGEMALAHVLAQGYAGRDNTCLTNMASYLAQNPPSWKAELHEPSSWSCVHGVERWRSDCGCTDGGHQGWNQAWRAPLRQALDVARDAVLDHFTKKTQQFFPDPQQTLEAFGSVLCGATCRDAFAKEHFTPSLSEADTNNAWKLLLMEEQMLAAYASCAWFFDELSRIEPVNSLTYALHALELRQQTGGGDIPQAFWDTLEQAHSNKQEEGNGKTLFKNRVLPRRETSASLILQALLKAAYEGRLHDTAPVTVNWPAVEVAMTLAPVQHGQPPTERALELAGTARIRRHPAPWDAPIRWEVTPTDASASAKVNDILSSSPETFVLHAHDSASARVSCRFQDLPWNKRQALAITLIRSSVTTRRTQALSDAPRALALFLPWDEAQHTQPEAHLWEEFIPEMLLALATSTEPKEHTAQAAAWLRAQTLSPDARKRLEDAARQTAMTMLAPPVQWDALARLVSTLSKYVHGMDWWAVQNALWGMSPWPTEAAPAARALGFALPTGD